MGKARSRTATARRPWPRYLALALALVVLIGVAVWDYARPRSGTTGVTKDRYGDLVQTVEAGQVPVFAQEAKGDVAEVYRFAASDEGKVLEWVPCFCGCGKIGHQHNRHCYVKSASADIVTFTSHGGG